MILVFNTLDDAQLTLSLINELSAQWFQANGYTVVTVDGKKQLVGKNAKTGLDEPNKARVITWDTVKESPEGTFYFTSLTGLNPAWANWKQNLLAMGAEENWIEQEIPSEWVEI